MEHLKHSIIGLFAGINGGIATVYVGQPLDTIKVKMQTFPEIYTNAWKCFRITLSKDGIYHGLYAGTMPALVANVAENAVLFCALPVCEHVVAHVCNKRDREDLSVFQHAVSGSFAAFWSSLTLCPTELVKCKVQSLREMAEVGQIKINPKHIGPWSVTKSIFREHGLKGFARGLGATFAREMPGYFFFFGGYETCRTLFTPKGGRKQDLGPIPTIISGGVGGVMLWVAIFPFDVVKSRMQIGHTQAIIPGVHPAATANVKSPNFIQILLRIARQEGIGALYRGLGPTLLRSFPATGALFLAVEWTRKCGHLLLDRKPVS